MIIELTTAALFLLSTVYGNALAAADADISKETRIINQPFTLEEYVRLYYRDTPILSEIARCESRFRHTGADGRVIRGEASQEDIGVMQINEFYHGERAEKLQLNLHTLDGNLAYAKWLYDKEGPAPWLASSRCWQRQNTLAMAEIEKTEN